MAWPLFCCDCGGRLPRPKGKGKTRIRCEACKSGNHRPPRRRPPTCGGCGKEMYYRAASPARCLDCRRAAHVKQCAVCGESFTHRTRVHCSRKCAEISRQATRGPQRRAERRTATCMHCSAEFTVTRDRGTFCSRDCSYAFKTLERLTKPPRPAVATKPKQPTACPVHFLSCSECSALFASRLRRLVCSQGCRNARTVRLKKLKPAEPPKVWSTRWWECVVCGADFPMPEYVTDARYCSKRCRRQRHDSHRSRALRAGVHYEYVRPHDVYERDAWTCGICGDHVDPLAKWPDQMCASIDHVVPLSCGGPHVADNLRLAHWLCNSLRGVDDIDFKVA